MKKYCAALCFVLFSLFLYAESYRFQITNVDYDITGCGAKFFGKTSAYAVENNVPLDKSRIFQSAEDLQNYIKDYEQRLHNTRAFEEIVVSHKYDLNNSQEIVPVSVFIKLKDSFHLLGLPYPKYSSSDGFIFKLKAKDTNFFGTLNEMNTALYLNLEKKSEEEPVKPSFGFEFAYNYPFKAGIFNSVWVNDYSFSYTVGNESPAWGAKTGLEFKYPKDKINYVLGIFQKLDRNFDYKVYDDLTYAGEEIKFSIPVTLVEINNFAPLKYTPYIDFIANWDLNGINVNNTDLSGPYITLGHSLSLSRVNWENQLRTGIDASLSNTFKYNFQRKILYPEISLDLKAFKSFKLLPTDNFMNKFGICTNLYSFVDIYDYSNKYFQNDGNNIGSRIRGYRDYQKFRTSGMESWYALKTPSAIFLSLDFPVHIFQTNFQKGFLRYFNFDFQISPFLDTALIYNKSTKLWFNPKDGLYAGGFEVLVYPLKWSSFTVRGSLGVDLGRYLFSDKLNTEWREECSKYEISIGIGLQY